MASPAGASLAAVKCDYCAECFRTDADKARHVQASHKNESQIVDAGTIAPAAEFVFGPFGAGGDAPPVVLNAKAAPLEPLTSPLPQFSVNIDAEDAGEDVDVRALFSATENDDRQPPLANMDADGEGPPPLISDTEGDDDEAGPHTPRAGLFSNSYDDS